ncbi:peptide deformylase [Collinsella tanakaei]|uniref:peptide deformylase n=1 Tax=Collinsella tanakaei TaxID=626935 RepID=UPI00195B6467|nr:peptide deformylase [Collinsella tanakaei]MBM6868969.1 peptide deformylase [Collinsella tanakaei]
MIRPIVTSPMMLRMPSVDATRDDAAIGQDLLDTLAAHTHECVGMAANMIGQRKRIIVVQDGSRARLMYNPVIVERANEYQTKEGCLSLPGTRPATRFRRIRVSYLDEGFTSRTETFTGYTAQIIQHEVDHCDGVLI